MTSPTASTGPTAESSEVGRVVIVGAGDLGTRIGRLLRSAGRAVDGWKRDPSTLPEGFGRVPADLTRGSELPELPEDTAAVVFCPTAGARSAARYRAVYRDGLRALLERADRLGGRSGRRVRMVLVSSTAVHGGEEGLIDETSPLHPNTPTGEVLAETEQLLRSDDSVGSVVLRLAGIYGPGRRRLLDQVLDGGFGAAAEPTGSAQVSTAGSLGTDPWKISNRIHVDDAAAAAAAMVTASECPSVLLGVDELPVPVGMVHDWLADELGLPRPWPHLIPEGVALDQALHTGREDPLWSATPAHGRAVDGAALHRFLGGLRHPDFRSGYAPMLEKPAADD